MIFGECQCFHLFCCPRAALIVYVCERRIFSPRKVSLLHIRRLTVNVEARIECVQVSYAASTSPMASLGICISKIVNVAAADTPSSYLKSSGGLALKELPGLNLTPRSTSLFNSDFELSSRPEYQTCSSQQEINVFERSFAPTIDGMTS